ncbi:leucyl aminopeptidase family protein [Legionella waltersii]|uniref:Leucine aminopeptidase n=1 Tax=Legionella waltersii TaxID=66969 RepID=A0A0W1AD28_9GAMM|nr:leucyl aminopeptidase family protein [Legionella waltersii]KTD79229.1 leucine aminopeptidase [Legionella waltersii]SNV12635.1 leucyl aminopeptidase [Legionella waltersii]
MQADLFYNTRGDRVVPISLISQSEWEEGQDNYSSLESNCFFARQFKGKLGDYTFIPNSDGVVEKAYIGSGTGNQESALANAALVLPPGCYRLQGPLSKEAAVNWSLAQYRFDAYKKWDTPIKTLIVDPNELDSILALSKSIYLVRDLINRPASDMGPAELAQAVEQLATAHKAEFTQWIGDDLVKENFPAIHAVGRASISAPRLLSLTWGNAKHPKITLIGKGVCFDSGGLDIKPSSGMRLMKKDMGGAAHVIGLAQWIMLQKLPIRLQVLIPAVENSIGPNAFRPGDVLTMRNGLTVEIENTDAEGRLVLADAVVKACEDNPELVIDFATLTGAARVAVGTEIAAMFSNDDQLAQAIVDAADKVSDPVWRLPLFTPYEELLNSNAADIANSSPSAYAGAIVAALFLRRFVTASTPWVHFDVMAWNISSKPGKPEGGEAMGLRAVAEYLLQNYG